MSTIQSEMTLYHVIERVLKDQTSPLTMPEINALPGLKDYANHEVAKKVHTLVQKGLVTHILEDKGAHTYQWAYSDLVLPIARGPYKRDDKLERLAEWMKTHTSFAHPSATSDILTTFGKELGTKTNVRKMLHVLLNDKKLCRTTLFGKDRFGYYWCAEKPKPVVQEPAEVHAEVKEVSTPSAPTPESPHYKIHIDKATDSIRLTVGNVEITITGITIE